MKNRIVEMSTSVMGRRKIKVVLHEIYPDNNHWNENGITYLEGYTRDNADSVKGMPLCAEFYDDDKDVPYGHGLTGTKGNLPIFEDSEQVGAFEDWSIEDIEINGEKKRCLCATGYVNEARYPKFVDWLDSEFSKNNTVYGSVEFCGTEENEGEIIYDGGYKDFGRVPMVYDYLGFAIISVRPADSSAILIEFNQAKAEVNEFDSVFNGGLEHNTDEFGLSVENEKPLSKTEYDDIVSVALDAEMRHTEASASFDDIFM